MADITPTADSVPADSVPFDKLHGRRRGRKLRPGQQLLLDGALAASSFDVAGLREHGPQAMFPRPVESVWLEVGFGGGEHLAWQARSNPSVGLIGCEIFQNGIVSLLAHVARDGLDNVRIAVEDARLVIAALPDASIGRAFVLFPDPWPKVRHQKRRFVQTANLDALARVMADGAELRLATDDILYMRAMLAAACTHPAFEWLARRPADWRERPVDWPQTRYEAKAIEAGRPPAFLRLRRRPRGSETS